MSSTSNMEERVTKKPRRSSVNHSRRSLPLFSSVNMRFTSIVQTQLHDHDVKAGKGHGSNNHPGNRYYLQQIQEQKNFYRQQQTLKGKAAVAQLVIEMVESRSPPGRFMEQNRVTKEWEVMPLHKVERKVKQALRDMSIGDSRNTSSSSGRSAETICTDEEVSAAIDDRDGRVRSEVMLSGMKVSHHVSDEEDQEGTYPPPIGISPMKRSSEKIDMMVAPHCINTMDDGLDMDHDEDDDILLPIDDSVWDR